MSQTKSMESQNSEKKLFNIRILSLDLDYFFW